jgi:hypothetical protein
MEGLLRQIPNVYRFKRTYLDENSDKIEVLLLGNSHSYFGLNPDCIEKRSYNASHVSQTLDYDLEIIEKYEDRWENLKFIVLPISYFSLYDKMSETAESWRAKDYTIYYKIRTSEYLPHYTEMLSGQLSLKFIRLWSFYVKGIDNIACTESGWGTSYKVRNPSLDLITAGEYAAKKHRRLDDQNFNEMCSVLESIIVFAERNGIRLILFTPPAFESYRTNLTQDQLNRTVHAASHIAQSHSNCLYFNFMADKSFTESDYYDADHLNEAGAKKLSLVIDSLINSEN